MEDRDENKNKQYTVKNPLFRKVDKKGRISAHELPDNAFSLELDNNKVIIEEDEDGEHTKTNGRLTIPAYIRKKLDIEPGKSRLVVVKDTEENNHKIMHIPKLVLPSNNGEIELDIEKLSE